MARRSTKQRRAARRRDEAAAYLSLGPMGRRNHWYSMSPPERARFLANMPDTLMRCVREAEARALAEHKAATGQSAKDLKREAYRAARKAARGETPPGA